MINVPADDPPEIHETANPVGEDPPLEEIPAPEQMEGTSDAVEDEPDPRANLLGEDPLEGLGEVRANPAAQEPPPPEPTPNPSGDGL